MEQNFTLKKLTVETLGVSCQYEIVTTNDDESIDTAIYQKKDSRIAHNTLRHLFESNLASIVAKICHLDQVEGLYLSQIKRHINPTTIKFSGKGENKGITISGNFSFGLVRIQFKTSKIKYTVSDNDFCAELTVLVADIEKEIQKYLFDETNASVEVFGDDNN